jgi:hypothetical protein
MHGVDVVPGERLAHRGTKGVHGVSEEQGNEGMRFLRTVFQNPGIMANAHSSSTETRANHGRHATTTSSTTILLNVGNVQATCASTCCTVDCSREPHVHHSYSCSPPTGSWQLATKATQRYLPRAIATHTHAALPACFLKLGEMRQPQQAM